MAFLIHALGFIFCWPLWIFTSVVHLSYLTVKYTYKTLTFPIRVVVWGMKRALTNKS